ncbi:hypothetical protein D3C73_1310230 [compost metagenome]
MIRQENDLITLAQHILLQFAFRLIRFGDATIKIDAFAADDGLVHIVALQRRLGDRTDQRQ